MRAALYRDMGEAAEVFEVEEVDRPEPGPGEVLVRVHASGINPTDYKARSGAVPRPIDDYQIPHQDGAGVIEAVGAGVDSGRVGERVWLWLAAAGRRWGTAAEWTTVPARQAVTLPDGASFELGASLGVPAMTASNPWRATVGESIHIHGGRLFICSRVPVTSWNSLMVNPGHTAVTWTLCFRTSFDNASENLKTSALAAA